MYSRLPKVSLEDATRFLVAIDSAFKAELEREETEELTLHCVMSLFAQYFGKNGGRFSEKQLRQLGEWLNFAVSAPGELENAVSTCFLEHTRQLKVNQLLAPYLSKLAKEKSHA
ncbi:MAG: hypothetical protein FWC42_09745 [Proteobacteria bacterium]|nr:hypothetical protein [Pseudomonadota bacterium]